MFRTTVSIWIFGRSFLLRPLAGQQTTFLEYKYAVSISNQYAGSDVNDWARILKAQLIHYELQACGSGARFNQCHGQQSTAKQQRTKRGVSETEGNQTSEKEEYLNEKEREKPNLCEMIWSCWSQNGGF